MQHTGREEALDIYWNHIKTGEPLKPDEVELLWRHGVAALKDFENVGGDLWRHVKCGKKVEE